MDPERYLARIGLEPGDVATPDRATLARLQRAHVTSVPFETLAVTGDPHGDREGEGPTLSLPRVYERVVERRRGGWCFELNGLFGWLLPELGFETTRVAARVVGDDGAARPPANHLTTLVSLDRPYLVDVGMGMPTTRTPLALSGDPRTDEAGVTWRVAESDRPDADYRLQYREGEGWTDRYVFTTTPRDLEFFEATAEFLATAPESPFTGDPVVTVATADGHRKLTPDALVTRGPDGEHARAVTEREWYDALVEEFGLDYPR